MLTLSLLFALAHSPVDTVHLVLVATTDVHGQVAGWDEIGDSAAPGGLTRVATLVDSLRRSYPGEVVLVDAGDGLQGSAFSAYFARIAPRDLHPVVDAMNVLGYDAATPGNHDFDFGAEVFDRMLSGSIFPWVSANLRGVPGDSLVLRPFIVVERQGARIAVAGLTTPGTMVGNRERLRGRLRVSSIEPAIDPLLRAMRRDADLVVVLCHSGLDGPSGYDTTGIGPEQAGSLLAGGRVRPDLVVLGHSHEVVSDSVIGGVHFVQPPPRAAGVSVVHVILASQAGRLTPVSIRSELVSLAAVPEESRLVRRLTEPRALVRNWLAARIGEADSVFSLAAARVEDVPLLRFIQSVEREATGATLSAASVPNLRAGLREGEVTRRDVFALFPGEATLVSVRVSGADLKEYLERSARYFYTDSTGIVAVNRYVPASRYDVIGGASYTVDLSRPPGSRVTRLELGGKPLLPGDSVTLALSSERQEGQGNYPAVATAPVVRRSGGSIRDLLLSEVARRVVLHARDFGGQDWALAPPDLARRARELFVKSSPAGRLVPQPVESPVAAVRDSLERLQGRPDSLATRSIAMLRLPAEPGRGGTLARLLADAYRNELRVDVAIVPLETGGAGLEAGPVTAGRLGGAVAAEPGVVVISVPGSALRAMAGQLVADSLGCCEVSGAEIRFDPGGRPSERVRGITLASGGALDDGHRYSVALSGLLVAADSTIRLTGGSCAVRSGCGAPPRLSDFAPSRPDRSPVDLVAGYLRRMRQPVTPPDRARIVPAP